MFNFNTKNTAVSRLLKISSFPLFRESLSLVYLFICLFIISLSLFSFAFLEFVSFAIAVKIPVFLIILLAVSLEIYLFNQLKIKNLSIISTESGLNNKVSLSEAVANPEKYNLAEFLNLES